MLQLEGFALHKAVWMGRLKLTRLLVEGGADVNGLTDEGQTPLIISCSSRYHDMQSSPREDLTSCLLKNGADPNIQDKSGKTALMYACASNPSSAFLKVLLEHGADPRIKDKNGDWALTLIAGTGIKEHITLLVEACRSWGKEVVIVNINRDLKNTSCCVDKSSQYEDHDFMDPIAKQSKNRVTSLHRYDSLPFINCSLTWESKYSEDCENRRKVSSPTKPSSSLPQKQKRIGPPPPSRRRLLRHNTTMECTVSELMKNVKLSESLSHAILHNDLSKTKESLLKMEKEASTSTGKLRTIQRLQATEQKHRHLRRIDSGSLPDICKESQRCNSAASQSKDGVSHPVQRLMGSGGQVLERQGSGTKLTDAISLTRPGYLPPLNVNTNPPIPDIGSQNAE